MRQGLAATSLRIEPISTSGDTKHKQENKKNADLSLNKTLLLYVYRKECKRFFQAKLTDSMGKLKLGVGCEMLE